MPWGRLQHPACPPALLLPPACCAAATRCALDLLRLTSSRRPLAAAPSPSCRAGHESWVLSVSAHPGGACFATGSSDSKVKLWDLQTRTCAQVRQPVAPAALAAAVQVHAMPSAACRPAATPTLTSALLLVTPAPGSPACRLSASMATKCGACASAPMAPASPLCQMTALCACSATQRRRSPVRRGAACAPLLKHPRPGDDAQALVGLGSACCAALVAESWPHL